MNEKQIKTFDYEGNAITFNIGDGVMVNATEMARSFGKTPKDFLVNKSTKELISTLSVIRGIPLSQLVVVRKGNSSQFGQGTWMHEDVALEFARWLSPKFAIWCNDRIKELLTQGGVMLTTPEDSPELIMARALQLANVTIEKYKQQAQLSESTIEAQQEQIKELEPLADYTRNVLQSTETYTMTQVAKEFGYSAVTFAKKLKDAGVLFQQSGTYMLKSKYQSKGYTKTRTAYFTHNNGTMGSKTSLVWTELGRQFLYAMREGRIDSNGNIVVK